MQKWEYKVISLGRYDDENKLNQLGQEGWELVSVVSATSGDAYKTTSDVTAYLKRARQ